MRILPIRNEESVSDIADKVFANLNTKSRKKVEAAILKENPTLKDFAKVRTGTIVKIPTIPDIKSKGSRSVSDPMGDLVDETVKSLAIFSKEFSANVSRKEATLKTHAELFKKGELTKALQTSTEGKNVGAAFKTYLTEGVKENRQKEKLALSFLAELQETIQKLKE